MRVSDLTLLAAPLVVAGVFAISGFAKLGDTSEGVRGLRELQVPDLFVRDWVVRAHPLAEILVAIGLVVLPTPWRTVAAVGAVGLMTAYTLLVLAAVRRAREVSCNCFGRRSEVVNRRTVVRNLALLALAVAALVDCAVAAAPIARVVGGVDPLAWTVILAVTAVVGWLIGHGYAAGPPRRAGAGRGAGAGGRGAGAGQGLADGNGRASGRGAGADGAGADGADGADGAEDDEPRAPIPAETLTSADGTTTTLTELVQTRAAVLVFLEPTCGSCARLLSELPAWRQVIPELAIVAVRRRPGPGPQSGRTDGTAATSDEPFPKSPGGYWAESSSAEAFGVSGGTPWAVLLGADGLIAGGPVAGYPAVRTFFVEVMEHLVGLA